MKSHKIRRLE
jgi:hypothetical protein